MRSWRTPFISPTVATLGCPARSMARSVEPEKLGEAMYTQVSIVDIRSGPASPDRSCHRCGDGSRFLPSQPVPDMEDEYAPDQGTLVALSGDKLSEEE